MKKQTIKLIVSALLLLSLIFSVSAIDLTIPEARSVPLGSSVTLSGYAFSATDAPGTGFTNEFYIGDIKAQGICVEAPQNTSITLYEKYSVSGTLSEENGEIKITNAIVTSLGGEPSARKVKRVYLSDGIDYQTYGGTFVKITGTATSPVTENGMLKSFILTDEGYSIKVVIPDNVLSLSEGAKGKTELTEALKYRVTVNVDGFIARNGTETYIKIKDCDDIDVQVHNCVFGDAFTEKEPTCGIDGLSVKECSCGRREETPIPALTHSFYNETEKTASCTEDGLSVKLCHNCSFREETVTTKSGHNYKERTESNATCETDGLTIRYCTKCDFTENITTPKTGHNYKERTEREPSCSLEGVRVRYCSDCDLREESPIEKTSHSYKERTEAEATCTADGTKVKYCTKCDYIGETITIPKTGHNYKERTESEPTCATEGIRVRYCSNCDFREESAIAKLSHSFKEQVQTEATCTSDGVKFQVCTKCGTKGESFTIPKTGHNYKERTESEPTCSTEGIRVRYCSNCDFREESSIAKLSHSFKEQIETEATCTSDGVKFQVCTKCGTKGESFTIPKTGHNYKERTESEPTCSTEGVRVRYCSNCDFREESSIAKTNHSYKEKIETEATCTTNGVQVKYCTKCDFREETSIPKTNHTFKEKTEKDATCTAEGIKVKYCSKCDYRQESVIPKKDHSIKSKTETAATCTSEGVSIKYCQNCDYKEESAIPKKDHSIKSKIETAATCTSEGVAIKYCQNCDYKEESVIPKKDHSIKSKTETAATCTSEGVAIKYCQNCDYREESIIPKKDHSTKSKTETTATCTSEGVSIKYCQNCDYREESVIPMKDHSIKTKTETAATCTSEGVAIKYCQNCDYREESTLPKTDHKLKDTVEKKATCNEEGLKKTYCENCGFAETKAIPVLAHSYENKVKKATFTDDGYNYKECKNCKDIKDKTIIPAVSECSLSKESFTYNGKKRTVTATLKDKNGSSVTDFNIFADEGKAIGKYKVTIELKGNYSGKKTLYYTIVPGNVTDIKAIVIADEASLTFKGVDGADGYRVYYKKGSKLKSLGTTTKTTCAIKLPEHGKAYTLVIKSYTKASDTTLWSTGVSAEINTGPSDVTGLKVSRTYYSVKFKWDKNETADGYRVYVRIDGKYKVLATTEKNTYTVTALKADTKYDFAVKAYRKADGKTLWGKVTQKYVTTLSGKPASFTAKESYHTADLSWRTVTGAEGYKVYVYDAKKKKYTTLKTVTENSFTVENLSSGATYKFAVKPYAKDGSKTRYGEPVYLTVTTKLKTPILTATVKSGGNVLSWKKVSGATGYEIYYCYEKNGNYKKLKTTDKLSFTHTGVSKNKTCYYKVRAYKTVNGKALYSSFSTVKKAAR